MNATVSGRIVPRILRSVNHAAACVKPDGTANSCLNSARDSIAEFATRRLQITNKVRLIQAHATRGRGMTRTDLDAALEEVVRELGEL